MNATKFLVLGLFFSATLSLAQKPKNGPVSAEYVGHIFKPEKLEPTAERIAQLKLPDGFHIEKYGDAIEKPRMMAFDKKGNLYVTTRKGEVLRLSDANKDGKADASTIVANMPQIHGIHIHEGHVYLIDVTNVYKAKLMPDGSFGDMKVIADSFPEGGQHPNRTLAVGPDGKLYISVDSTCNACEETNKENATLVRMNLDGTGREIFAIGLRNTIGFDWHPSTDILFGMDHGIDWLGDEQQKEELNRLEKGGNYGWPYLFEDGKHNLGNLTAYWHWRMADKLPAVGFRNFLKKKIPESHGNLWWLIFVRPKWVTQ